LQFGYESDRGGGFVFVYAAYRRRFDSTQLGEWAKMEIVVPDFVGLLLGGERGSRELCVVAEKSISIVNYDSKSRLPVSLRSFPRHEDEEGKPIDIYKDLKNQGQEIAGNISSWTADSKILTEGQRCFITLFPRSEGKLQEYAIKREDLWPLDIRDSATITAIQGEEQKNNIFWKAILATAACFALLVFGEIFLGSFSYFTSYKQSVVGERQPMVDSINGKSRISNELMNFQDETLEPFAMLVGIEAFRPEAVYYNKVSSLSSLQLEIEGMAPSQAMVNQFKTRVERSQIIESVSIKNSRGQSSGTQFTAVLTFKPGALNSSVLPAEEEVTNG